MVRALIAACGTLAYGKFARLSDHLGLTQSLRDGGDQYDLSAWTISLFSTSAIYVGPYPRTSPIIIGGDRTARLDRELHAVRRCLCLRKGAESSLRNLCSAGCTAFMGSLSENIGFCALQAVRKGFGGVAPLAGSMKNSDTATESVLASLSSRSTVYFCSN